MSSNDWIADYYVTLKPSGLPNDEQSRALKSKYLPQILYRYCDASEHAIKLLEKQQIWLSDPLTFKNPYDCVYTLCHRQKLIQQIAAPITELLPFLPNILNDIDYIISEIRNKVSLYDVVFALLERDGWPLNDVQNIASVFKLNIKNKQYELSQTVIRAIKRGHRLTCFSESDQIDDLWVHSADGYQGICIAYASHQLDNTHLDFLHPVRYDNHYQETRTMPSKQPVNHDNVTFVMQKPERYAAEKEWRFVIPAGVVPDATTYPFLKPIAIKFGTKTAMPVRQRLLRFARQSRIPVFEKYLRSGNYALSERVVYSPKQANAPDLLTATNATTTNAHRRVAAQSATVGNQTTTSPSSSSASSKQDTKVVDNNSTTIIQ